MTIEVRNCKEEELPRFVEVLGTAFGGPIPEEELPRFKDVLEVDRMFAGFDGETMVSTGATFSFELTVPGGHVPAAGVTMVGSLPTHRRKGTMRNLMRAMIDDAKSRNEPVAMLFASEESIYQRFGYGLASNQGHIKIEREKTTFLNDPGPVGETRLITLEEAREVLPPIYDAVRPTRAGMFARSPRWWRSHSLADPERTREGASIKFCVVYSRDGVDEGYALYRTGGDWDEDAVARGFVNASEVIATNPVAYREVWRYLFGIDLVEYIKAWYLPEDLPLELMLQEPRRLRFAKSDSLWLRLVDVPAALEARTYAADGEVSFALADEFCPWNDGEWTLRVKNGQGSVERGGEPDISLDVSALAAVYLGGYTFGQLERALRAQGCTEDAVIPADAMFRTNVAPWCVENF